jgi:hypothetical protein
MLTALSPQVELTPLRLLADAASEPAYLWPIFVGTLCFTVPGATLLLSIQGALVRRERSLRSQAIILEAAGVAAGAGVVGPVAVLMNAPPMWIDVAIGAWFGLCTASMFVCVSGSARSMQRARQPESPHGS